MNISGDNQLAAYRVTVPYAPRRNLRIDFSPTRFQRVPHPDAQVERQIDAIWAARRSQNPTLFNAGKFRFSHATITGDDVVLNLGLTDYKTYIGTHARDHALARLTRKYMAQPLGNATVVETADALFPVLIRSTTAADIPGGVAFPGGHAEPDEVSPPLEEQDTRVRRVLAQGARDEVLEEIFADQCDVPCAEQFVFLGLVERIVDEKSTMIYYTKISTTSDHLQRKYRDRNVDKSESTSMHFLTAEKLSDLPNLKQFTPVAELLGALDLWQAFRVSLDGTRDVRTIKP